MSTAPTVPIVANPGALVAPHHPLAVYNNPPQTPSVGDSIPFQTDATGKLLVLATIAAESSAALNNVNVTQFAGTAVSMDAGGAGAGTQRVVLSTATSGIGTVRFTAAPVSSLTATIIQTSSSGNYTAISANSGSGQSTKVYRMAFTVDNATTVQFRDGATNLTGGMSLGANGSVVLDFEGEPWFSTSTNADFVMNFSSAVSAGGRIYYVQS